MARKPFSMRIEEEQQLRFKALSTVTNLSAEDFLKEALTKMEVELTPDQTSAYEALMKVWKGEEVNA